MDNPKKAGRPPKDRKVVSLVFQFATIEQIQKWCMVSRATAYKYKNGDAMPSPRALALFRLHYDGKVLGPEWEGFTVKGKELYDPENKCLTAGQIRAYQMVLQLANELSRRDAAVASALEWFHRAFAN